MYRGRYRQGQEIPLAVLVRDGSGLPAPPDAVPGLDVYGSGGKVLSGKPVPVQDRFGVSPAGAFFMLNVFLGAAFPAGSYTAVYGWTTGNGVFAGGSMDYFDVSAGGDPAGNVLSAYWYERPQAEYVLYQLDSGRLRKGRNPGI